MFSKDIQLITTSIMVGAAYRALHDSTTDHELADQLIEGARKYLNGTPKEWQIAIRQCYLQLGIATAPKRIVAEEVLFNDGKQEFARLSLGKKYPLKIMRRISKAMDMCIAASDNGDYLGVIMVSEKEVVIAELPWSWGFPNLTWQFRPQYLKSQHRDYFVLMDA